MVNGLLNVPFKTIKVTTAQISQNIILNIGAKLLGYAKGVLSVFRMEHSIIGTPEKLIGKIVFKLTQFNK